MPHDLADLQAPGTKPAGDRCTSNADFLVYCSTNYFGPGGAPPSWGYVAGVKSSGAGLGSASPVFTVGGNRHSNRKPALLMTAIVFVLVKGEHANRWAGCGSRAQPALRGERNVY